MSTDNKPYYCDGTTWHDLTASGGGGGSAVPGGVTKSVQVNSGGTFNSSSRVRIDNDDLYLGIAGEATAPADGITKLVSVNNGRRYFPGFFHSKSWTPPSAAGPVPTIIQPSMWRQKVGLWMAHGDSTATTYLAFATLTVLGTSTARATSVSNIGARARRVGFVGTTTAGSLAGVYDTARKYAVGGTEAGDTGGFFFSTRFMISDEATVAGARMFIGMIANGSAPSNVEPSGRANQIGIAQLSTDGTQLYLVYGGSSAQASIPLGLAINNFTLYDLTIFAPPGTAGTIHYSVEEVGNPGGTVSGTITATTPGVETPTSSTRLAFNAWRSNNAQTLAVGLDLSHVYVETDY